MKGPKNMNIKPKKENSGHEPKKWSDNLNSAKYESRSVERKTGNNK